MSVVVILYWDDSWSAVAEFARAMAQALTSLGVKVRSINVMDINLDVRESVLSECLSDPELLNCDLVISIGAPPLYIRVGDQWLFEILGKKFLMLSLDALFYDRSRVAGVAEFLELARTSPRLGFIWGDRDSARIINHLTCRPVHEMRSGGFFHPITCKNRLKRVAVVASMGVELAVVPEDVSFEELVLNAPPQLRNRGKLIEFAEAIEQSGPIGSIPKLAVDILGIHPEDVYYTNEMARYISRMDAFQKRHRRVQTIEALDDVPIDIFGPNWEPYTAKLSDCRYLGSIPYESLPTLCQRYSVILDFNPGWGHALHDRVYTGVGNGCRVMTNSCRAISDLNLPDSDAIIPYDVGDPNLAEVALHALALPPMEPASLLAFRAENSWLTRMDELLFVMNSD